MDYQVDRYFNYIAQTRALFEDIDVAEVEQKLEIISSQYLTQEEEEFLTVLAEFNEKLEKVNLSQLEMLRLKLMEKL